MQKKGTLEAGNAGAVGAIVRATPGFKARVRSMDGRNVFKITSENDLHHDSQVFKALERFFERHPEETLIVEKE